MKLTPLRLIKENYSSGTWSEFCKEFKVKEESVEIVIYYDSSAVYVSNERALVEKGTT